MEEAEVIGGRYRLLERLGDGGMSVVWRAHDEVLGRQVAVKLLACGYAVDAASRQQLRIEALAVARLSHPHITSIYDYGEWQTQDGAKIPYIVMELLRGRSLAERLAQGALPWPAALVIGCEVASALAAAHARGLVHRDIKPGNVVLTAGGAKVVDFGIAALAGEWAALGPDDMLMGTPAYLAPERLTGGPVLPASDVYAFGVLLFRLLTGALPWHTETTAQMLAAHMNAEPMSLPPIDGLPPVVTDVYRRCLAKSPEDRPSSHEVVLALASITGVRMPVAEHDAVAGDSDDETEDVAPVLPSVRPAELAGSEQLRGGTARSWRIRVVQATVVAGSVVAAALLLGLYTGRTGTGTGGTDAIAVGPDGSAQAGRLVAACNVRFQIRTDADGKFSVEILIRNTTEHPVDGWTLEFAFPDDQVVAGDPENGWSQVGSLVTGHGTAADSVLSAGGATIVGLSGSYHNANPLPTGFALNGEDCGYTVIGASGQTRSGGPSAEPITGGAGGAAPVGPPGAGNGATGSPTGPETTPSTSGDVLPAPARSHRDKPSKPPRQ